MDRSRVTLCVLITIQLLCGPQAVSACGGVFTSPEGQIKSPGYPGKYPHRQDCVFVIKRGAGERITINFHELDLEESRKCDYDFVQIRNGDSVSSPELKTVCGTDVPLDPIKSFGNSLWIHFRTNERIAAGGFLISYTSAVEKEQFFLITAPERIFLLHPDHGGSMPIPIAGLFNPVAADYDPVQERVYWTDEGIREIRSAYRNGSDWRTLVAHSGEDFAMTIAIDPAARLLFYGEVRKGAIYMVSLLTFQQRTVISHDLYKPISIVLDSTEGLLFWIDLRFSPRISRSRYDGSQRMNIVTRHLSYPNCLALDRANKRLYWVDKAKQRVEWTDYEGKGRSSQISHFENNHIFAFDVSLKHLYVINWQIGGFFELSVIWKMEKDVSNFTADFSYEGRLKSIRLFDETHWKTGPNPCGQENGGCSHFCVPRGGHLHRCMCPDRQILDSDGRTCHPQPDAEDEDYDDDEDDDDNDIYEALQRLMTDKTPTQVPRRRPTYHSKAVKTKQKFKPGVVIKKNDYLNQQRTAQVRIRGPRPFDTDGSKLMTLTCEPEGDEVAAVVWRKSSCLSTASSTCVVKPDVPKDDGHVVGCDVYFSDGSYGHASFTIQLNYPPPRPPRITGYRPGYVLTVGDPLFMTCTVKGGKPLVSSVDFLCYGHPDTLTDEESGDKVQAYVKIERLTSLHNGMTCICSAEWKVPEMYEEVTSVTLRVQPRRKQEL